MLREYEGMLILPAEADEALVSTAVDRIAKTIAPTGGKVDSIDRWGRRRFAYEIARQHEGYYVVVRFQAEPSVQAELDHTLKLADEVMRHKVLLLPDEALEKAEKAEKAEKSKATTSPASAEA
jgi:small subunit ribosomal protein S6